MKRKRTRILWTFALTTALSVPTAYICVLPTYADDGAAAAMQLAKTEGTVSVTSGSEKEVPLVDKMRLYNGYQVETMKESYAWIELDRVKMAKLDAASEVSIRKRGKKLEILLGSGNVFFNVTEPLAADESLNIRTSTMVAGIRGTSGWVEVTDENHVQISVLEGSVEVSVSDPVTGESRMDTVSGGQTALCTVNPQTAEGEKLGIERKAFTQEEIGGFILTEVAADASLAEKIFEKGGMDLRSVTAQEAQAQLKKDEATVSQKLTEAETAKTGQAAQAQVSVQPTWTDPGNNAANREDSGNSWQPDDSTPTDSYTPPVETKPLPAPEMKPLPAPEIKPNPEPDSQFEVTLTAATLEDVKRELARSEITKVIIKQAASGKALEILNGETLNVPKGKTLEVCTGMSIEGNKIFNQDGGRLNVESGATILCPNGILNYGYIRNDGTIQGTVTITSPVPDNGEKPNLATLWNTGTIDGNKESAVIIDGDYNVTIQENGKFTTDSDGPTLQCKNITPDHQINFSGGYIQNEGTGPAIESDLPVLPEPTASNKEGMTIIRTKGKTVTLFNEDTKAPDGWEVSSKDGWKFLQRPSAGKALSQSSNDIEPQALDGTGTPSENQPAGDVATLPENQTSDDTASSIENQTSDTTATPSENQIAGDVAAQPENPTSGAPAVPSENQNSSDTGIPSETTPPGTTGTPSGTTPPGTTGTPSGTTPPNATVSPSETKSSDSADTQTSGDTATPPETTPPGDPDAPSETNPPDTPASPSDPQTPDAQELPAN